MTRLRAMCWRACWVSKSCRAVWLAYPIWRPSRVEGRYHPGGQRCLSILSRG